MKLGCITATALVLSFEEALALASAQGPSCIRVEYRIYEPKLNSLRLGDAGECAAILFGTGFA